MWNKFLAPHYSETSKMSYFVKKLIKPNTKKPKLK